MARLGPSPPPGTHGARTRLTVALLALSAVPAAALFVFNYWFAVLRIGFVPEIALHPYVYVLIVFPVSWGILLWVLALAWWLVERSRLPPKALMHIAAIEGAAAALSMGSRGQMLLHVVAAGLALWHGLRWRGWAIPVRGWVEIGAVLVPLFAGALVLVSIDRSVAFARALRMPVLHSTPPQPSEWDPVRETPPRVVKPIGYWVALEHLPIHLRRLLVLRWVGLDGVLTMVGRERHLGLPLLQRALVESPAAGVDALFQRASGARSIYPPSTRVVFMTIPGPVAFAAFSGSQLWCFLILFALVASGALIEYLAARLTANPAVGAVAGVALAYLVVQLNFPRTLMFFVVELLGAVAVIAAIGRVLREPAAGAAVAAPARVG